MAILAAVSSGSKPVMAVTHLLSAHLVTALTDFIRLGDEQGGIGRAMSGMANAAILNSRRMGFTMLPARGNFLMTTQTEGLPGLQQILTNGRAVRGMAAEAFFLGKGLMGKGQSQFFNLFLMAAQTEGAGRPL
jgi:hypothetical protein